MSEIDICDNKILEGMSDVISYIYDNFGTNELLVFHVTNPKSEGFVIVNGNECLYIRQSNKVDLIKFLIDDDRNLYTIMMDNYNLNYYNLDYEKNLFIYEDKFSKLNEYLYIYKNNYIDTDGYDGTILYGQYNKDLDIKCELTYQQMYCKSDINKRAPIYSMHTKEINCIFIDKKYQKRGGVEHGIVGRNSLYFANFKNEYLESKYYRIVYVKNLNGDFITLYPYGKAYDIEEIKNKIKFYEFKTEIPSYLFDIYNHQDEVVNEIESFVPQIKDIINNQNENKMMLIKIHQ